MTRKRIKKIESVVWDFNGTLIDDVALGVNSVNTLLRRRGLKEIASHDEYRELFCFPVIDYYKRVGFDFEKEPFSLLAVEWVEEYKSGFGIVTLREGVLSALSALKNAGIKQYIISASERSMLSEQLKYFGIDSYFDGVYGIDNINAGSKAHLALEWASEHDADSAIFIGDTLHDYDTASAAGIECFLITGGHQSREQLLSRTDNVIDLFEELVEYVLNGDEE